MCAGTRFSREFSTRVPARMNVQSHRRGGASSRQRHFFVLDDVSVFSFKGFRRRSACSTGLLWNPMFCRGTSLFSGAYIITVLYCMYTWLTIQPACERSGLTGPTKPQAQLSGNTNPFCAEACATHLGMMTLVEHLTTMVNTAADPVLLLHKTHFVF